jgi:hypothetical protein
MTFMVQPVPPPAPYITTAVIGRAGQEAALALPGEMMSGLIITAPAAPIIVRNSRRFIPLAFFMVHLLGLMVD